MKRSTLSCVLSVLLPLSLKAADEAAPPAAAKDSAAPKPADDAWKEFEKLKRSPEKKPARPITIEHVNDEQLLALLHGTPSALVEWPNGDRTQLVVKH